MTVATDYLEVPDIIRNQTWTMQIACFQAGLPVNPVSTLCKIENSTGVTTISSVPAANIITIALTSAITVSLEQGRWGMDCYAKLPDGSIQRAFSTRVQVLKGIAEGLV